MKLTDDELDRLSKECKSVKCGNWFTSQYLVICCAVRNEVNSRKCNAIYKTWGQAKNFE